MSTRSFQRGFKKSNKHAIVYNAPQRTTYCNNTQQEHVDSLIKALDMGGEQQFFQA